ncbi:DDB1- and CUL4-associated factor 13 [Nowakowskiella sp. JEL0407]|nr:DDB1- and CUL4-associated factor 13 [Nowakowskiella sp. JEL0407]
MKIRVLSRQDKDYSRERKNDIHKTSRNLSQDAHPFARAREYTRALNATKIDRLLSKPFIASLSGHVDGIYCLAKHPTTLNTIISGSADGDIRIWDLSTQDCRWNTIAHKGFVRGITFVPFKDIFLSTGEDKTVKMWSMGSKTPINTFLNANAFTGIDHHRSDNVFVTSSVKVDVWDHSRAVPITSLSWGAETVTTVKMNQTETSILASCGTDRTIILYDLRTSMPIKKNILTMASNAIAWNPMEAFNFTVANEDHNLYTFDMRKMDRAVNVLKDHVSAVLDVDYSPTGTQIVSGSYDHTVRIFNSREGSSRDIYHTERMQRVFCVKFSMDEKFVFSGSDDGNLRVWKANASEKLGVQTNREREAIKYSKALKEKYKHMPEIRAIDKHRRVPKAITSATRIKRIQIESERTKEENRRKHSKPDTIKRQAERKKNILVTE